LVRKLSANARPPSAVIPFRCRSNAVNVPWPSKALPVHVKRTSNNKNDNKNNGWFNTGQTKQVLMQRVCVGPTDFINGFHGFVSIPPTQFIAGQTYGT
jgi:hypothetical protein